MPSATFSSPVPYKGVSDIGHGCFLTSDFGMGGFINAAGDHVTFNYMLDKWTPTELNDVHAAIEGGDSGCVWDGGPVTAEDAKNFTDLQAGPPSGNVAGAESTSYGWRAEAPLQALLAAHDFGDGAETEPEPPSEPEPAGELVLAGYMTTEDYSGWMKGSQTRVEIRKVGTEGTFYCQVRTYPGTPLPPVDSGGIGIGGQRKG